MFPKARLGKRSPLGALLSSSGPQTVRPDQSGERPQGQPGFSVCPCGPEASEIDPLCSLSSRPVSSSIDVPKRSAQEVDMDELMAAMVLSSLSCSPRLHSNVHEPPVVGVDCGGDMSDSSSGYWSVGHSRGSPAASPPITEQEEAVAPPTDEGLSMELEELFEEPAPRRRRNSEHAAFRCLWPGCEKVLTSIVGIKRHIRSIHLQSCGGEHERCSRSEEDFYYTEVTQWEEPHSQSPPALFPPGSPGHAPSSPPSSPGLSNSAPSSGFYWQVQVDHSYQAPLPVVTAATPNPVWTAPSAGHNKQGLAHRVRSVSVGEQWLQHSAPCRRIRSDAKKCRKVYGIEHREQWCTACRWKKACQRFLD